MMRPETVLNNAHERLREAGWRGMRWRSRNDVPIITIATGRVSVCNLVYFGKTHQYRVFYPINWTKNGSAVFKPGLTHQSRITFDSIQEVIMWLSDLLLRHPKLHAIWLEDELD